MSAYTTQASIEAAMGAAGMLQALDDDGSGTVNVAVLNQIIADVSSDIDGMLGGLYAVPFNPAPPMVSSGCLAMVCYEIMRRALTPDEKNTFESEAKKYRTMFMGVRKDGEPFDLNTPRAYTPFVAFQQCLSVDMTTA